MQSMQVSFPLGRGECACLWSMESINWPVSAGVPSGWGFDLVQCRGQIAGLGATKKKKQWLVC